MITIAVGLFLITYIEGVSVSKTFARKGKYEVDSNQEFVGYGAANLAASFFQGMPLYGSASNTAINYESNAKSQLSGAVAMRIKMEAQKQQTTLLTFRSKDASPETLEDIRQLRRLLRLDPDAAELTLVFGSTATNDKE